MIASAAINSMQKMTRGISGSSYKYAPPPSESYSARAALLLLARRFFHTRRLAFVAVVTLTDPAANVPPSTTHILDHRVIALVHTVHDIIPHGPRRLGIAEDFLKVILCVRLRGRIGEDKYRGDKREDRGTGKRGTGKHGWFLR
jgi:hypothetical protein